MNNELDEIEDLIILALESNKTQTDGHIEIKSRKDKTAIRRISDTSSVCDFSDKYPGSCHTFDYGLDGNERLYTPDVNLLSDHPSQIIADSAETIVFNTQKHKLQWSMIKKIKKPSSVFCVGKPSFWYEYHYREISRNLDDGFYAKRYVALNSKGLSLPIAIPGITHRNLRGDFFVSTVQISLLCSIIEDAYRANSMLCKVKECVEIKFPVPLDDYKSLFSDRDGPLLATGKKRPIIHWVSSHLRNTKNTTTTVKKHVRGVDEFVIDGLTISIKPNARTY